MKIEVISCDNVTELIRNECYEREASRIVAIMKTWSNILQIFKEHGELVNELPKDTEVWYVIGLYGPYIKLLSSSKNLAPYNPPKYLALENTNDTYLLTTKTPQYRSIYVNILRELTKAKCVYGDLKYPLTEAPKQVA